MTKSNDPGPRGSIDVNVSSGSIFLSQNVPVEIRDSEWRLVAKAGASSGIELPEGLYQVSAVLEDGRKHSSLVQVKGGQRTSVSIAVAQNAAVAGGPGIVGPSVEASVDRPRYWRPQFTRSMEAAAIQGAEVEVEGAADSQLLEVHGAQLLQATRTLRIFRCNPQLTSVASAVLQVGPRRLRISLPISPARWTPSGSCVVRVESTPTGTHLQSWISPERTVANAMQNMLSAGYVIEAAKVADDAVELLRDKYSDPAGAVLGALILLKTGRLQRWLTWVENLARDFAWLPDGKVLLAQLAMERESASDRALSLVLEASQQRMMYTECHSLLLDLLRRWPREEAREERQEAIKRLTDHTPDVDWESICLSHALPGWES